jgi:spore germination cell wall hydrolase CwlJ-like protein
MSSLHKNKRRPREMNMKSMTYIMLVFACLFNSAQANIKATTQHRYAHGHSSHSVPKQDIKPKKRFRFNDQVTCVANTLYRESRNSIHNMQAVASVIQNRLERHWGVNHCHVIRTGSFAYKLRNPEPKVYAKAREIALDVMSGNLPDNTNGAMYFHASYVRHPPKWARNRTAVIGGNVFYRG